MKINKLLVLVVLISSAHINAISLVYSLKIRRLFSLSAAVSKQDKSKLVASAVPIIYKRDSHIIDNCLGINIKEKRLIGGSIFNLRYVSKKLWWMEITSGIEKESLKSCGTVNFKTSKTGLDDIILSGGYNFIINDKTQFVLYGLSGFPVTRKITKLETYDALVGTRFFSLGAGAEFSYGIIDTLEKSLIAIAQCRFIHFFDRKWFPILPKDAKIQPGNVTDLLFTLQYRKRKNIFEVGYNPTFFTNEAVILKTQTIKGESFIRDSGYITYSRLFKKLPGLQLPGIIGFGLSVGNSQEFNTKIFASWLNLSVMF